MCFHFSAGYPNAGSALNISTHVINAVYIIHNVSVTGMPIRLLHFWHPVIYGIIYSFFSLFYRLDNGLNHHGNPYIYKPINWNNAGQAVGYCLAITFVGIPVIHFALFGVHFVKINESKLTIVTSALYPYNLSCWWGVKAPNQSTNQPTIKYVN